MVHLPHENEALGQFTGQQACRRVRLSKIQRRIRL